MKTPVSDLPVMKSCCKTCPFREVNGLFRDIELVNIVTQGTLFKGQQICHATEGKNRKANHRCKGSFNYNKEIYDRMGLGHLLK